ncbi:transcriptional regulator [Bacillus sp. M6-12]|uniref:helix-turn-helix domain-containing protein n=1 Tax=Bacillus sp. M6-12 TaxID=2054166 RepID=UPI000C7718DA|nr:helix-turn-helix domain-containing protein [Bacillus sp. M6-12]PLS15701.1 transcriptional regulator [Bacillus sp. M6-12]
MSNLAKNIKACREKRNMTQQELAIRVRCGTKTIEKYESGEQIPDMQTVMKLSTVLDIPASELLEQEYQPAASGIDPEIEKLVQEIGVKKAKLFLRKAKEFSEEDLLRVMQMLYEIKYGEGVK